MLMDRRTIALGVGAAFAASVLGSSPSRAAAADDAVNARVEAFRTAQVAADAKALEGLSAPELSYSHSDGRVEDRAAFVTNATAGRSKFTKLEYRNPQTRVVGDVATVRFNWVGEQVATDGKTTATNLHILMVWRKQGSDWHLLARSATKI